MSSQYREPTSLIPRRGPGVEAPSQRIEGQRIEGQRIEGQRIGGQRIGGQRIGDAERSAVCEELSAHYAAGRLTDDELDVRVTAAMAARTFGELRPLIGDLPSATAVEPTAVGHVTRSGTPWSALDVLALVALVGTVGIALLGALAVVLGGEPDHVVIAILTATTAGFGGMALTQVLHRGHRSVIDRATQRARDEQSAQRRLSGPA